MGVHRNEGGSYLTADHFDGGGSIVATTAIYSSQPTEGESAALEFLNSDLVLRWAEKTLGL